MEKLIPSIATGIGRVAISWDRDGDETEFDVEGVHRYLRHGLYRIAY